MNLDALMNSAHAALDALMSRGIAVRTVDGHIGFTPQGFEQYVSELAGLLSRPPAVVVPDDVAAVLGALLPFAEHRHRDLIQAAADEELSGSARQYAFKQAATCQAAIQRAREMGR